MVRTVSADEFVIILEHLTAAQHVRDADFPSRAGLRNVLGNVGLDQIVDSVRHHLAAGSLLLGRQVPPLQPSREDALGYDARLMQRHLAVRTDRVLADARPAASEKVYPLPIVKNNGERGHAARPSSYPRPHNCIPGTGAHAPVSGTFPVWSLALRERW